VFAAGSTTVVRAREEAIVAAGRGMRMIMAIAIDIAATAVVTMFIPMIVAMIVRAHRMMVVRSFLCAHHHWRQSGHGKGGEG
jgi:hypothetical protein